MKKTAIIMFVVLLVFSSQLFAQDSDSAEVKPDTISWYYDYNEAISAASSEGRYILLEFYTDW